METSTDARESKRNSFSRARKLRRDSRRRTKQWGLELNIDKSTATGVCAFDDGNYSVSISGQKFDQPITDYSPISWDLLVQKCITAHENAHVLYTDFEDFSDRLSEKTDENTRVYKSIHNILEDGRIEELIVQRYPVFSQMLLHFRANFMHKNSVFVGNTIGYTGNETAKTTETVSIYKAIELGLLDKGLLDVGRYDALIDETENAYQFHTEDDRELFLNKVHPLIEDTISEVQSTSNPQKSNKLIFEFVDEIIEYIDKADNGGKGEAGNLDGERPDRPDDADENSGPPESDMDIEIDVDEEIPVDSEISTSEEIEDSLEKEIENERQGSSMPDEDTELEGTDIEDVPSSVNGEHSDLFDKAQREAQRIRQHIDIDVGLERKVNTRTGTPSSIVRAHINDDERYKSEIVDSNNPDFVFGIIIDRSGSVGSKELETEILAVLQSVIALNNYPNIDTTVFEMYDKEIRRILPLGADESNYIDRFTHSGTSGGTPLSDALQVTRDYLTASSSHNDKNRILVITDGKPDSKRKYQNTLEETRMPVAGISVKNERFTAAGSENYHRHITVSRTGEGLNSKIIKILSGLTESSGL